MLTSIDSGAKDTSRSAPGLARPKLPAKPANLEEALEVIEALQKRVELYEVTARLIRSMYSDSRSPVAKQVIAEINKVMRQGGGG